MCTVSPQPEPVKGHSRITLSTTGTARITFADGSQVTLYRQATTAQALSKALALYHRLAPRDR